MKTIGKILGWIGLLIVVAFAGSIGKLVGRSTAESYNSGKQEAVVDGALMQAASQLNENLPMMVDAETRWDNSVGMKNQFHYNYTLVNYAAADIDANFLESELRPTVANTACTTEEMQVFFRNGVSAVYNYKGNDGLVITRFIITPQECGY